jgi:Ran GTPase-activating protein (RanGAP) involved in mRNA processing and transport
LNQREPDLLDLSAGAELSELKLACRKLNAVEGAELVKAVATSKTLKHVSLHSSVLSPEILSAFIDVLGSNTILKSLVLSFLHLGATQVRVTVMQEILGEAKRGHMRIDGAHALGSALQKNTVLQVLHLQRNDLGCAGVTAIADALRVNCSLRDLDLSRNPCTGGMAAMGAALKVNTTLTSLSLQRNHLVDEDLADLCDGLTHNVGLRVLDLEANEIGSGKLARISVPGQGQKKVIHGGAGSLARVLETNTTMDVIILRQNRIQMPGACLLAEALKFMDRPLRPGGLPRRIGLTTLVFAIIHKQRELHSDGHIHTLDLSGNFIEARGAAAIADALTQNEWLTTLKLSDNALQVQGACALAEGLKQNSTLQLLDVSQNDFGDKGCEAFSTVLKSRHSRLTDVNIAKNGINRLGATAFAQALYFNSTLRKLEISDSNIQESAAEEFGIALANNTTLETLGMARCNLGEFSIEIAKALAVSRSLTALSLSGNRMDTRSCLKVVQALPRGVLQKLDISKNFLLGHSGLRGLFETLADPAVMLTDLDVRNCDIVKIDAEVLEESMQSNTRILTLLLDDTGLPASMGTRIEDLVQRNRKDSLTKVLEEVQRPVDVEDVVRRQRQREQERLTRRLEEADEGAELEEAKNTLNGLGREEVLRMYQNWHSTTGGTARSTGGGRKTKTDGSPVVRNRATVAALDAPHLRELATAAPTLAAVDSPPPSPPISPGRLKKTKTVS